MAVLIENIKALLQVNRKNTNLVAGKEMKNLPQIENAYVFLKDGKIHSYGPMNDLNKEQLNPNEVIDATGKYVLPSWIDSHTHLVYAGNREGEFVDRINGLTYEEIANRGGGILNSAAQLNSISEEELYDQSAPRLKMVMKLGTGAIEIKSGYGLTLDGEKKMLRVARQLGKDFGIPVKTTFLGAHAVPKKYKNNKTGYLDFLIQEVLPEIADEKLADYIDIFCEKGYFDLDDTSRILEAGAAYGLKPKTHVNQFNSFGGVKKSIEYGAISVDHLEELSDEDLIALAQSNTMPVALPGCSLFLSIPYTPARRIIDYDLPLALASDYNPGSAPSGNMNLVVSLACIKMKMTPEEAINAATINAAYALEMTEEMGSIDVGKKANLIMTSAIPSYGHLPYAFGENCIEAVFINGKKIN